MNTKIAIGMMKVAKIMIKNREYEFICNTLSSPQMYKKFPWHQNDDTRVELDDTQVELLDWIRLQLRGKNTFGDHLRNIEIKTRRTQRMLRLEWISNMIKALENGEELGTQPIDNLKF